MRTIILPVPPGVRIGATKTTVQVPVDAPTEPTRKRFITLLSDGSGFCKYPKKNYRGILCGSYNYISTWVDTWCMCVKNFEGEKFHRSVRYKESRKTFFELIRLLKRLHDNQVHKNFTLKFFILYVGDP